MKNGIFSILMCVLLPLIGCDSSPKARPESTQLSVEPVFAVKNNWDPEKAVLEAEQDIRNQQIKFYWAGTIAAGPVGVPLHIAERYPHADAGTGCLIDEKRQRQFEYARRYNEKVLAYVSNSDTAY